MARIDTLPHFLTDVADAIREKKGTSETIQASDFDTEIENLPSGGSNNALIDTSLQYDTAYGAGIRALIKSIDEIDTSKMTSMQNMFSTCTHLHSIPLLDTSNVTNMNSMFSRCTNLINVPLLNTSKTTNMNSMFSQCTYLRSVPLLDALKVTNMGYMFSSCSNLETVPLLNTSSVTNMANMFSNSTKLTNESLDNILQMCINATSYTGTKTLFQLGFRSNYYPTSRIQALPHYQDFLDAGWTIGY